MVRIGLFGVFEGEDALTAAIVRAELAQRVPGLELRVYTPGGRSLAPGFGETIAFDDHPLGPCTPARQEELAATLDAVAVVGTVPLDAPTKSSERLLVEGLGPFEPDVPAAVICGNGNVMKMRSRAISEVERDSGVVPEMWQSGAW